MKVIPTSLAQSLYPRIIPIEVTPADIEISLNVDSRCPLHHAFYRDPPVRPAPIKGKIFLEVSHWQQLPWAKEIIHKAAAPPQNPEQHKYKQVFHVHVDFSPWVKRRWHNSILLCVSLRDPFPARLQVMSFYICGPKLPPNVLQLANAPDKDCPYVPAKLFFHATHPNFISFDPDDHAYAEREEVYIHEDAICENASIFLKKHKIQLF